MSTHIAITSSLMKYLDFFMFNEKNLQCIILYQFPALILSLKSADFKGVYTIDLVMWKYSEIC